MKCTIIFSSLFSILMACGQKTAKSPVSSLQNETCSLSGLPSGWVVVGHRQSIECPGSSAAVDFWNTYQIKQVASGDIVCWDSPISSGYVKRKAERSNPCVIPMFASMNFTNAFTIEKL